MSRHQAAVWPPFVRTAIALAITAGFGLGGTRWPAAEQAHGHIQVFGWAGLMVLGVGFHFLPRLRGAPNVSRRAGYAVFALF